MSELGEPVAVGMIDADEVPCPFDHTEPQPPDVENDLIGVGSKLGQKLKSAKGTHLYAKIKGDYEVSPILNPKARSEHPFKRGNRPVKINVTEAEKTREHLYPVSCAAHHCIPAQESLKESQLLGFMCKKGASEPVKDGSYADGQVWSDVGYDVNGSENGIWLPGSYAVGGGRGGMGVWADTSDGDEDGPEDATDAIPDPASNLLVGAPDAMLLNEHNSKWQYVSQAVSLCPGQFHDRHVDYSAFVQSILKKIFENYLALLTESYLYEKCPDCKKRAEKFEKDGVPTPYGLVDRLNKASDNLKVYLNGTTWRINIFTSKWGKAYMEARLAKRI
jgi:hypothetical protein